MFKYMEGRKYLLLNSIINEYIASAEPVGSNLLVGKYDLNLSSATVRNEMMDLEKEGYLCQPHISAGRVPTEKGYKFYIDNFFKKREVNKSLKAKMNEIMSKECAYDMKIKNVAKILARESKEVLIIAFGAMNIYYTGISNLFVQPEFYEHSLVCNLSEVIDQMDEVIYECYESELNEEINILIGSDNPFNKYCSSIMSKCRINENQDILMCILGPMRMDYNKNAALVEYASNLLSEPYRIK